MFYTINYLVLEWLAIYALAYFACACRVSSLNDETLVRSWGTFDVSVEDGVIVLATCC